MLLAVSLTSPQQVVVMNLGNDTTQQTQRTFAAAVCYGLLVYVADLLWTCYAEVANLLLTCYGELV